MALNVTFWMFFFFGVITGFFIIFYLIVDRRNRSRPVNGIGGLLRRNKAKVGKEKSPEPFIPEETPPDYCPVCAEYVGSMKTCRKCGYEINRCKICSKIIRLDDDMVACPYCGVQFHRNEFLEWLKIKAFCPNCRTEMDLWEFKKDDENAV